MIKRAPRLSARFVATTAERGRHGDGDGLYLQVGRSGTKAWVFRYMREGCARMMGLGPVDLVPLAEAREKARDARRLLHEGIDPLEDRRKRVDDARIETARTFTFRECAEGFLRAHESSWRNAKHRAQWRSTLQTYALPTLGDVPVDAIDTAMVTAVLEAIWGAKPETASRVRGRVEAVLDWATVRGHRQGDNPARWRGHLDKLLPARSRLAPVRHHAALPWTELPGFMGELRARGGTAARALEFLILTAARTGEVLGARWSEIDVERKVWVVPSGRMKGGRLGT